MHHQHQPHHCVNCQAAVTPQQLKKTIALDGYGLCPSCRKDLDPVLKHSSRATLRFYFALCAANLSVKLHHNDQMIVELFPGQLHLSVDLPTGNSFPVQELATLHERLHSSGESLTINIPYSLSAYSLYETVSAITEFVEQAYAVPVKSGRRNFFN